MASSGMVYEDAEKLYTEVRKSGEAILDDAFDILLGASNSAFIPSSNPKALPRNAKLVGYNTTFFQRRDIVEVPLLGASAELKSQVLQTSSDGKIGYVVMCNEGGGVGTLCTPATGLHEWIMPASGIFWFLSC